MAKKNVFFLRKKVFFHIVARTNTQIKGKKSSPSLSHSLWRFQLIFAINDDTNNSIIQFFVQFLFCSIANRLATYDCWILTKILMKHLCKHRYRFGLNANQMDRCWKFLSLKCYQIESIPPTVSSSNQDHLWACFVCIQLLFANFRWIFSIQCDCHFFHTSVQPSN